MAAYIRNLVTGRVERFVLFGKVEQSTNLITLNNPQFDGFSPNQYVLPRSLFRLEGVNLDR